MRAFGGFELPRVLVPSTAARLGITRSRVRSEIRRGNWRPLARGAILTRPEDPTRADWAALGIALAGPTAALSGWDALRVRGLGDARPPTEQVLVLSRHTSNRVVGPVRIRCTNRPYRITTTSSGTAIHPLTPIVATARAVADAALAYDGPVAIRALVTSAIQRRRCSLTDLIAELRDGPRQHSRLLRLALSDALDGARSAAEASASARLGRSRVPPFELNVPVVDRTGTVLYVVDVLWRSLRAALEIDSREYHFAETDWKATLTRHNQLTRLGLTLTHYPPSVVMGRSRGWLDEVEDWLRSRARELGVTNPSGHGPVRPPIGGGPPAFVVDGRRQRK